LTLFPEVLLVLVPGGLPGGGATMVGILLEKWLDALRGINFDVFALRDVRLVTLPTMGLRSVFAM